MRKNNVKNPAATFLAFFTLGTIWRYIRKMIKKYHIKQDI